MSLTAINLNEEEKKTYIESLIYILHLNNNKDKSKKIIFMENQLREIGLPIEDLKNYKSKKTTEEIVNSLKKTHNIKIRRYILREMILLAVADHELDDKEISTIFRIGIDAGIKDEKISDFFLWAAKGIEWQIDGIKLIEEDL